MLCETLGIAQGTYYVTRSSKSGDKELLTSIEKIIMKWPYYSYRRVTHQLKREGYVVGETFVRRLLKQIDHSCSVGRASISTTNSQHGHPRYPNLIKKMHITHLDQVWVADIKYIRLRRQFFLPGHYFRCVFLRYQRTGTGKKLA